MKDVLDFFGIIVVFLLVLAAGITTILLLSVLLINTASHVRCDAFGRATGNEVRWDWGCYVKVDGKFVPQQYVYGDAHELRIKEK